jgi:quercetin dioxygenase-like cupin family protein
VEWQSGNVFIRPNRELMAGQVVQGHAHNFDHTSIVFTGAVSVKRDEEDTQVFRAPSHFLVRAGVRHEITALEDNTTFWCVYSHRDAQGDVVQTNEGWMRSYV